MSYRPITDFWICARHRNTLRKRYGGYPLGFPERARRLLGASLSDCVFHVCGGLAKWYPYPTGFGPKDVTMDLDPEVEPDFLRDARDPWPWPLFPSMTGLLGPSRWRYILIDPPYSPLDAGKYPPGAKKYPTPFQLLSRAVEVLDIGGKVGIIHYQWAPLVPGLSRELAVIAVGTGRNQRARFFTVFERIEGGIFEAEKMQTDGETNQKKRKKEEETEDPRQKTFSSLFGSTQENSKKQEKGQ